MTDREILEYAAKACGMKHLLNADKHGPEYAEQWNPLTDDGDCFRMETALGIRMAWGTSLVEAYVYLPDHCKEAEICFSRHNGDKNAARRLASCRVAAQIGREMP